MCYLDYEPEDKVGTYEDAETIITDGQGWLCDGYYCNVTPCPYIVRDIHGEWSCYGSMYHECKCN